MQTSPSNRGVAPQVLPPLVPKTLPKEGEGQVFLYPENPVLGPALSALSARMGSMIHLQELQVLIQDTVNATLLSLRGTVDSQVKKTLENMQGPTVRELVAKSITEEVIQSTAWASQLLARQNLESLELGQRRCGETLTVVEKGLREVQEEAANAIKELQGQQLQVETDAAQLQFRVAKVEKLLADRPDLSNRVLSLEERLSSLRPVENPEEGLKKFLQEQIWAFESRSRENLVSKESFEEVRLSVKALEQHTKEHGEQWLLKSLKPYAQLSELEQQMSACQTRLEEELRLGLDQAAKREAEELARVKAELVQAQKNCATKSALQDVKEESRQARGRLALDTRRQIAKLGDKFVDKNQLKEAVDAANKGTEGLCQEVINRQKSEEIQLMKELTARVERSCDEMRKVSEEFSKMVGRQQNQEKLLLVQDEAQVQLIETTRDMQGRVDTLTQQQKQSRLELTMLQSQLKDTKSLQEELEMVHQHAHGVDTRLAELGTEASSLREMAAAREAAEKKLDVASLKAQVLALAERCSKVEEEQKKGIVHLQDLHNAWLLQKPPGETTDSLPRGPR